MRFPLKTTLAEDLKRSSMHPPTVKAGDDCGKADRPRYRSVNIPEHFPSLEAAPTRPKSSFATTAEVRARIALVARLLDGCARPARRRQGEGESASSVLCSTMLTANNPTTDDAARRRQQGVRGRGRELAGCFKVDPKVHSSPEPREPLPISPVVCGWCHATEGNLRNAAVCVRGK